MAIAGAMFSLYVIWGSTYLAIRLAIDGFPPLYMAAIRQLVAGAVLYAVMRATGAPRPTRAQWKGGFIVGTLLVAGGNGGISLGERSVDSSFAAIVVASMPLWVAVMGLYYGRKPTRRELIGLCVGFSGVVVLNAGGIGVTGGDPVAFAAVIASPILWAWGSVLGARVELARGPMASATQMLCGGAVLVVLGAAFGEHFTQAPSAKSIGALAYLVVLGSLVAFSAYGFLLRTVRPAVATSYAYVNPIVAIALGVAFAGETISPRAIVATALTLGGVAILATRKR
jgi:drug/metabolite transporter (DMT)-like permease